MGLEAIITQPQEHKSVLGTAGQADASTNGEKFLNHLLGNLSCQVVLVTPADLVDPRKTKTSINNDSTAGWYS